MLLGPPLFLLLIGMGIMGAILCIRGWIGVPVLSEPKCAKCRYDLRGYSGAPPTVCSECGADLTTPGAVRWGEYRRRPRLMWTGAAMLALPALAVAVSLVATARGVRLDRPLTNQGLIANLSKTANQPWDWQELERRHAAGRLSNEEAAQAVEKLIASLGATPGGAGQPLTWSGKFLTRADAAGAISDEQYLRLARAYYGVQADVRAPARARQGQWFLFAVNYGGHWDLPGVQFVKALRAVKLPDGRELPVIHQYDREAEQGEAKPDLDLLSHGGVFPIDGKVKLDLPPGEHELTFVVDAAALKEGSVPRVAQDRPGQARRWPPGRARWTVEVPVKVTVVESGQSPVEVVNDPALDPRAGIKVKSARVTRKGQGRQIVVELNFGRLQVPVSFDVFLRVAGQEYPAGWHVVSADRSSGTQHARDVESLPPDVTTLDVILRPNPKHAEGVAGADRVWGGTVTLTNVPLQRYDVDPEAE